MLIQRVLAPNPGPMTLTGTNTYIVGYGSGELAVIDPGPHDDRHLAAILDAVEPLGRLTTVLVTHRHGDHLPAARPLCQATGATLVGHADLPGVERSVADGEVCFGTLQALQTPGHTRESLCFWDPRESALFTGDLVAGTGTVVLDDQPGALGQYLASLERLLALAPKTLYPGHGPLVEDGVGKLHEYLDHRHLRMQQVVETLEAVGPATVDELVGVIYTRLAANLAPMAARNVRANLDLLASQGRVAMAPGEQWELHSQP